MVTNIRINIAPKVPLFNVLIIGDQIMVYYNRISFALNNNRGTLTHMTNER